jgi:PQQ-like domain
MRRSLFLSVAPLLLGASLGAAQAGVSVTPAGPSADLLLTRFELDAAGNGWGQSFNDLFLKFDGGSVRRAEAASEFGQQSLSDLAAVLPDGGALVRDTDAGINCRSLRKLGRDGRQQWTSPLCGYPYVTPQGEIWVAAPRRLVKLAGDGSIRAELPQPALDALIATGMLEYPPLLKMTADGKTLIAASMVPLGEGYTASLLRVDLDSGQVAWRWRGSEAWQTDTLLLQLGEDGSAYLLGRDTDRALQLARIGVQGTQHYLRRALTPGAEHFGTPLDSLLVHRDGRASVYLYNNNTTSQGSVVQLDAAGQPAWQQTLRELQWTYVVPGHITEAADGSVLVMAPAPFGGTRFFRLDRSGQIAAQQLLPSGTVSSSSGPLYLAGSHGELARLDADGGLTPTAYLVTALSSETRLEASVAGPGDAQFLLTTSPYRNGLRFRQEWALSRVDADGRIAWTRRGDQLLYNRPLLSTNAARVCSASDRQYVGPDGVTVGGGKPTIACFDAASGQQLWSREVLADFSNSDTRSLQLLADNRVLLTRSDTDSHVTVLFDANGGILDQTAHPQGIGPAASNAAGQTAVSLYPLQIGQPTRVVVYGPDGRPQQEVPGSTLQLRADALALAQDGALAVTGWDLNPGSGLQYLVYTGRGGGTWRRDLARLPDGSSDPAKLLLDADTLYVVQRTREAWEQPAYIRLRPTRISAYARADGTLRWQYESINMDARRHAFALSADGRRLLSVHGQAGRLRVELIDKASGTRLAEQFVACEAIDCEPHRVSAGSDGVTRISADIQTVAEGRRSAVYARAGLDRVLPNARIDQPGIAGAWWSPYANGEGLALDWLPDSRTVFGAWFTYTREGGNDAAQLRWYTVQANGVANTATALELPILQTAGGNFDAGPPVAPQPVGRAWLNFTDCNNGTLRYAFDAAHNGGSAGSISLSRLTPATEACVLADGTTQAATGARPPENGFDTRMAGSWYEEATSGQGLQLTVQPGGVFFAPWFTYDPQETGNDTARQHWFTLQGNLATAVNGRVELLLVQTIGGAFDSVPTNNAYQVGTATLTMNACDRATLEYRFTDDARAGSYANRTGTLELAKAGGCAP